MRVPEKRREDRQLCAGLMEVRWIDAGGGACVTIANLDDLSAGGMSLMVDCPLPLGARVEFSRSGRQMSGEVRYCNRTEIGWSVGVEFGPDSQWDRSAGAPEHLLDPKSIPEDARPRGARQLPQGARSALSLLVLGDAMRREEK